jgi:hypothetical protein
MDLLGGAQRSNRSHLFAKNQPANLELHQNLRAAQSKSAPQSQTRNNVNTFYAFMLNVRDISPPRQKFHMDQTCVFTTRLFDWCGDIAMIYELSGAKI